MPVEYLTPAIEDRAVGVQQLLADRGHHRAPAVPDLLIAATAELAGLAVLHRDKEFDLIAAVSGQQLERERLGLHAGGALELVSTPEGVLLERRRQATVTSGDDGLPMVTLDDAGMVNNVDATQAIHDQRDER